MTCIMKYFVDKPQVVATGHTRFYEFQKGIIDYENDENPHWKDDSLYLEDETVIELDLDSLFAETLENYDFMGDNFVNRQDWERIAACALKAGGIWKEVIEILSPWVEDTFSKYDYFTIIGM